MSESIQKTTTTATQICFVIINLWHLISIRFYIVKKRYPITNWNCFRRKKEKKKKRTKISISKQREVKIAIKMTSIEKIQSEYPLHWAVWNDDHKELQDLIKTKKVSLFNAIEWLVCGLRCDDSRKFSHF